MLNTTPAILRALARNGEFPAITLVGRINRDELSLWTDRMISKGNHYHPYLVSQALLHPDLINHFSFQNLTILKLRLSVRVPLWPPRLEWLVFFFLIWLIALFTLMSS